MFKRRAYTFLFFILCSCFSLNAEDAPKEKSATEQIGQPPPPQTSPVAPENPVPPPAIPSGGVSQDTTPPDMITGSYESAFMKMLLTLGALVVLIILSVWMIRRISSGAGKNGGSSKSMRILERKALSAKSVLYLIEVEGKKVLISESQLEVRPITTIDTFTPEEE